MEIIIKADERLIKLNYAIEKLKQLGNVKLVGYFINEKIVFYNEIPQILITKDAQEFTLEELDIPSDQSEARSQCDRVINERVNLIEQDYFKNKKHIQPILIYTSELKHKDKSGNIVKIFDSLNLNLRTTSILTKKQYEIGKEWFYRYASTLLKHLKIIKGVKGLVYRGVNYDPEGKIGEFITFKPFTSTSKNEIVPIRFAV